MQIQVSLNHYFQLQKHFHCCQEKLYVSLQLKHLRRESLSSRCLHYLEKLLFEVWTNLFLCLIYPRHHNGLHPRSKPHLDRWQWLYGYYHRWYRLFGILEVVRLIQVSICFWLVCLWFQANHTDYYQSNKRNSNQLQRRCALLHSWQVLSLFHKCKILAMVAYSYLGFRLFPSLLLLIHVCYQDQAIH